MKVSCPIALDQQQQKNKNSSYLALYVVQLINQ